MPNPPKGYGHIDEYRWAQLTPAQREEALQRQRRGKSAIEQDPTRGDIGSTYSQDGHDINVYEGRSGEPYARDTQMFDRIGSSRMQGEAIDSRALEQRHAQEMAYENQFTEEAGPGGDPYLPLKRSTPTGSTVYSNQRSPHMGMYDQGAAEMGGWDAGRGPLLDDRGMQADRYNPGIDPNAPPEANEPWPDPKGGQYPGNIPPEAYEPWDGTSVQKSGDQRGLQMNEMREMIRQRILDQRNGRHITEDQVLGLNENGDGYYLQIGEEGEPREVFFKDVM